MAAGNSNSFEVVSVHAGAIDEAVVSGFVRSGSIRTGDLASFLAADGIPLIAPITRISTGGTEVKVVREGQKTNLNLGVDSRHLHMGTLLTTPSDEGAYAPTMVASELSAASVSERPAALSKELVEIGLLVNRQRFDEAHSKLLEYASTSGADRIEVDRLFARISIEARGDLADAAKGLEYIKSAYAKGGQDNADVIETLAQAHGANGNAQQGLRFLEQLFFHSRDAAARDYYQKRIEGFRLRYSVPDTWQVIDHMGEVIFTATDIGALEKGLKAQAFPAGSKCRKNRTGKIVDVADAIKVERPSSAFNVLEMERHTQLDILAGTFGGMIAGIVLGSLTGFPVSAMALVFAVLGAAAGFGFNAFRTKN